MRYLFSIEAGESLALALSWAMIVGEEQHRGWRKKKNWIIYRGNNSNNFISPPRVGIASGVEERGDRQYGN